MVEAGGQRFRNFRCGLDYAFIHAEAMDAERVIGTIVIPILVPAPARWPRRVYESLQGRPEVGPLPTPRRRHAAILQMAPSGFTDVSSVFNRPSRAGATLDRTPVRKR